MGTSQGCAFARGFRVGSRVETRPGTDFDTGTVVSVCGDCAHVVWDRARTTYPECTTALVCACSACVAAEKRAADAYEREFEAELLHNPPDIMGAYEPDYGDGL